jgi:hypothetical protein
MIPRKPHHKGFKTSRLRLDRRRRLRAGKRLNQKSKSERSKLEARCDEAFNAFIRFRDKMCMQCGATEELTCGHLIPKARMNTRWNEDNAFGQCATHNANHVYDPQVYQAWFIERFGLKAWEELQKDSLVIAKFSDNEIEEKVSYFKSQMRKAA